MDTKTTPIEPDKWFFEKSEQKGTFPGSQGVYGYPRKKTSSEPNKTSHDPNHEIMSACDHRDVANYCNEIVHYYWNFPQSRTMTENEKHYK